MQQKFFFVLSFCICVIGAAVFSGNGWSQDQEIVIVKYGSLSIKSADPDAKIYIDDIYKGTTENIIESVLVGNHLISCRTDKKTISGRFQIRKNETLRLEALFDDGKLVVYREPVKEEETKPEPAKNEKPKKPAVETKKVEQKNPSEERRKKHLNVVKIEFEMNDQKMHVDHSTSAMISKYVEKKDRTGKYYRTKQGVLLCDSGPCELTWSVSFIYTDEEGKTDALLCKWTETVFNGITPAGTSKREMEWCLNGQCSKGQDTSSADTDQEFEIGRYQLDWSKTSLAIRRSDIMKEILDAGRSPADYY